MKIRLKKQRKSYDKILLLTTVTFTLLGILFILDASGPEALNKFSDRFYFARQQLYWGVLGTFLMLFVSRINYSVWKKFAVVLFFLTLVTLIVVLIPPIGVKVLGAKRWIVLGEFTFQPSEIVKLTLAIYIAKVAASGKKILAYLVPLIVVLFLVMLQPDLGTALIIAVVTFSQLYISGLPILNLFYIGFGGVIASLLLIIGSAYRRSRLLTFLHPINDVLGRSYHITQILYALGSGGLLGVGLGQSRQKYLFLPEAATDSIFAVISEEIGFVGAFIVILLFIFFIARCIKIVKTAPDKFSFILALGITSWLASQTLINLNSIVVLTPLTGVPLPFFSYGGSSIISILIAIGILLNISRHAETR